MGMFNDINDAMGQVGGLLKSPAMSSVDNMKNAASSLDMTVNLNQSVLEAGFPGHGNAFYQQMQEIQNLSNALDECGNYAQDAVQAATEDYIKNTGLQQAGRDLANTLGQHKDEIDCVAGFATLFDSKGILDDVLGLGDLPQIQSRVQQIALDATNPEKLANMITNLDAVQGLLEPFNDFCTGMKDSLNKLVEKDLASLNAILNKLAQWSAFTNLATGDPCALVNNNQMLGGVTSPVMDDILDLYDGVIGGDITGAIGDIFTPENPSALVGNSAGNFTQSPGTTVPFSNYFSTLGTNVAGITTSIDTIITKSADAVNDVVSTGTDGGSTISIIGGNVVQNTVPQIWNGSDWVDDIESNVISGLDSISTGLANNSNSFNSSLNNFKDIKEELEFGTMMKSDNNFKHIEVSNCSGGTGNTEDECLNSGGNWNFSEFTESTSNTTITTKASKESIKTIVEKEEVDKKGSGADIVEVPSTIRGKPKNVIKNISSTSNVETPTNIINNSGSTPKINQSRMFPIGNTFEKIDTAAKIQTPGLTPSFESSVTQFNANKNIINRAKESGDYSKVTICKCNLNYKDETSCLAGGGKWSCQTGTSTSSLHKRTSVSADMITSPKSVELSSLLPSSDAFEGIT